MEYKAWKLWYEKILKDFGFSKKMDEYSAKHLNKLLDENSFRLDDFINHLPKDKLIHGKSIVFGAGPSLKTHIKFIKEKFVLDDYILIAADGATTALLEENMVPDIVVTDLDGKLDDLFLANDLGSLFVIHAHGNNLDEILKYTRKFTNVLGTTQSKPMGNLYNFGGFTDGDRAVFLAIKFKMKKIILAGMDFGTMVTSYSRPDMDVDIGIADEVKQKKLKYAENLISWISNNKDVNIEFIKV